MEDYYKIFENIKLDIDTIKQCVNTSKTWVIPYGGLFDFDEMFKEKDSAIILLHREENGKIQGHFIAMIVNKNNKTAEIFDPYGHNFVEMMHLANMNNRLLHDLIYQSGYQFTFNKKQVQKKAINVNTCGAHCISRIAFKFLSNAEYVAELEKLTKKKKIDPDFWVTTIIIDTIMKMS